MSTNGKLGLAALAAVLAVGGGAYALGRSQGSGSRPASTPTAPVLAGAGAAPVRPYAAGVSAATAYLGLSEADLRRQLAAGKTLAQIADATNGRSAAGLVAAVVDAERQVVEQAVSSGRLKPDRAGRLEASLDARVRRLVDGGLGASAHG